MTIKLTGFIKVKQGKKVLEISAQSFSLEEEDVRHIGDGDHQYECLYVYRHGDEFRVTVQITKLENKIDIYPPTVTGNALLVDDQLGCEDA